LRFLLQFLGLCSLDALLLDSLRRFNASPLSSICGVHGGHGCFHGYLCATQSDNHRSKYNDIYVGSEIVFFISSFSSKCKKKNSLDHTQAQNEHEAQVGNIVNFKKEEGRIVGKLEEEERKIVKHA
jgi:hypothetical protein